MCTYYYDGHYYGSTDVPPGDYYEAPEEDNNREPIDWEEERRKLGLID